MFYKCGTCDDVCVCVCYLCSLGCRDAERGCCVLCQTPTRTSVTLNTNIPHGVFGWSLGRQNRDTTCWCWMFVINWRMKGNPASLHTHDALLRSNYPTDHTGAERSSALKEQSVVLVSMSMRREDFPHKQTNKQTLWMFPWLNTQFWDLTLLWAAPVCFITSLIL